MIINSFSRRNNLTLYLNLYIDTFIFTLLDTAFHDGIFSYLQRNSFENFIETAQLFLLTFQRCIHICNYLYSLISIHSFYMYAYESLYDSNNTILVYACIYQLCKLLPNIITLLLFIIVRWITELKCGRVAFAFNVTHSLHSTLQSLSNISLLNYCHSSVPLNTH